MGPAGSCILTFFEDFEAPRRFPKSLKIIKNGVSKLDDFLECLLEGLLDDFRSQSEAKTIKNESKNGPNREKSRSSKSQRFFNEKMKETSKEIGFSNKNVENIET